MVLFSGLEQLNNMEWFFLREVHVRAGEGFLRLK